MATKDDVLRALEYGKGAYYQAIQAVPSYAKQLERVRTDYNERQWIDFSGFYPKFPTEEFNKRRDQYQAKYGNTVNVPGYSDIIHLVPKAAISAEERAAHLWATSRGLPSPLTEAQRQTMKYKKFRFLKALSSATPTWMKTIGAVGTTLDNVEDAFITISVLGRIAAKVAPRLAGRLIPGLGWVLLGADILNLANIAGWVSFAANKRKRLMEDVAEKNPFHAKAKARRTLKLQRSIPTFGEFLEIAQTTDQLFGVGLCLGGLMGLVTDAAATAFNPEYWGNLERIMRNGNVNEISSWAAQAALNDYTTIKKGLQEQFTNLKDEAYRLKATDQALRKGINDWITKKSNAVWGWIKAPPDRTTEAATKALIGSMIMSTTKDDFLYADHTQAYITLDTAVKLVMPWWIENDPLSNFKDLRGWKFKAPAPKDPTTIDILNEVAPGWTSTVKWPHLDTEYATAEQLTFTYAPRIKDSFQAYALNHAHQYDAMIAGQQVVEFTKDVIRSYSDDNQVTLGMSAWWAVAQELARQVYIMPPDTPRTAITALQDYIGQYERSYAVPPSIKDVVSFGTSAGIQWMRSVPARAFPEAAEIFPEWKEIQEQLADLYIPD